VEIELIPRPDIAYLVQEIRKPHVTLNLLWMEYKAANPDGYQGESHRRGVAA
jgi:transposase